MHSVARIVRLWYICLTLTVRSSPEESWFLCDITTLRQCSHTIICDYDWSSLISLLLKPHMSSGMCEWRCWGLSMDAYAMNHALLLRPSNHIYTTAVLSQSTARARHWQWSSLLNVNGDQTAQRDKPLNGSRGEAPSNSSFALLRPISLRILGVDSTFLFCYTKYMRNIVTLLCIRHYFAATFTLVLAIWY